MRYLPFALLALLLATPALGADAPPPDAGAPGAVPTDAAAPVAPGDSGVAPAEEAGPPRWVYMVIRVKLTDTDVTQVAFLRHPAITTLEDCEQERAAGMMTGWRFYNRHYFKTLKGISYKVDFRCVEGLQYLSAWRPGDQQNRYYLVRTTDGKLDAQPQEGFFACRRALRKAGAEEGIDAFCGRTSQAITEPPTEPEETETAPADDNAQPVPVPAQPTPKPPAPGGLPWAEPPSR